MKTKHSIRTILNSKNSPPEEKKILQMLTCYDYQTARMLNETDIDLILVGDSLGNVVLGYDSTIKVTLEEMITFGSAVCRGAPNKFIVLDMPFGTYFDLKSGLKNAIKIFQKTGAQAIKFEGAADYQLELIKRLGDCGVPVMGHIGLQPQSVHAQGGYFTHGKDSTRHDELLKEAKNLEQAGAFSVVLECVEKKLAQKITQEISIPTIGIGSGSSLDGQVLVINDLLGLGPDSPPSFCTPLANLYQEKKKIITHYLTKK